MANGKRIVISTFGSFGDVHPYIAIALELQRRGHHPVLATSEVYREKLNALGLELQPVRPDLPGFDEPDEVSRLVGKLMDAKTGTEEIFKTLVMPHLPEIHHDLLRAVEGADLLLTHPLPLVGPIVAEQTGVPWVSSVLAPLSFFSAYDPPVVPQLPFLQHVGKLSPFFVRLAVRFGKLKIASLVEPVYRLRQSLGLPRGKHPLFEGQHSPRLVLALFSSVLGAPQPDWPARARVTGFPFYDRRDRPGDEADGELDPALRDFLDAGPPPIVFTLGTSAIWVAKNFYQDSMAAARHLGQRALLLVGDERNRPAASLPEGVAAFDYAPFGAVLPRARAVVHQGGVGTTGQALRAGVPALVVPFAHDQFDNAARVVRLGCARTLPSTRYHADTAARELKHLLDDPSYAAAAATIGQQVRREDGARVACDLLEDELNK